MQRVTHPPRARRGSPRRRTQRLPSTEEEMEAQPTASERRQEEGDDDGGEEGPTNKMARRFTSDENGALVDEVVARWDVLFGSRSHRISAARRQQHWQQVTDKVNTVGAFHRDRPTVYKRFSDLKRWLRAKLVTRKAKAQKTGGGRVPPLRLKPYERRLLDILSKEGSEGVDTDWRIPPQTSRPDSGSDQDQDDAAQQPQEEGEAEDPDRAPEAQAIGGPPQEEGRRLGEQPAAQPGLVDAMMTAMQPLLHQQRRQELWMRRWMAQIHTDIRETQVIIHRGFQDLVAAQPHRPGGSAEGEVPGPPAAPPPPP
ncbi:uncharacterized protein LOC121397315 [Xenopus laevis]|uniref:Uncharacterized protein LOC121397315 n=1 Tax=Xenopus laevis TaxID=8355 RepID=A0A8J1LL70_XENLA|nr:uncharacterized protein LOC121397315 [Xenopus laevis]